MQFVANLKMSVALCMFCDPFVCLQGKIFTYGTTLFAFEPYQSKYFCRYSFLLCPVVKRGGLPATKGCRPAGPLSLGAGSIYCFWDFSQKIFPGLFEN